MRRSYVVMLFTTVLMAAALSLQTDAESKYKACSLLIAAEVEAVLGTKVNSTRGGDSPSGSTRSWITVSPTVGASLSVNRGPQTPQEQAAGKA